jgi:ATP-dependent RNA helicase DDX23/PRP28
MSLLTAYTSKTSKYSHKPMSRKHIPSLEELMAQRKSKNSLSVPKFLSKKERSKINESLPTPNRHRLSVTKTKNVVQSAQDADIRPSREEEILQNYEKLQESNRRGGSKFKFDWKEEEDTLASNDLVDLYDAQLTNKRKIEEDDDFLSYRRKNKTNDSLKDQHWSVKPLDEMKPRDWRILKEDFEITTRGSNLANPLRFWSDKNIIPKDILSVLEKLHYKDPTPIQRASIPVSLSDRDIIGIAETGSGKTLAYLIPMLTKILKLPKLNEFNKKNGPYGLILVPTRELAQQIEFELNKFLQFLPKYNVLSLVGGKLIERDVMELQNNIIDIIIATPGRLIDCLENRYLALNQVKFLVLDESDKMIEMNFSEQVEKITEYIKSFDRQNMMFTATMNNEVEKLSKKYVDKENCGIISIGNVNTNSKEMVINDRITQKFETMNINYNTPGYEEKKFKRLEKLLLNNHYKPPIIIFINYKETADFLSKNLLKSGFKASVIHGSKSQEQRELALRQLKEGKVDILIGTNVASRGIDINNVSLVINYQMPKKIDDYIHRIGRTGRAGNYGTSVTFLNEDDFNDGGNVEVLKDLKKLLTKSGNKIPEEFRKMNDSFQSIV